MAEQRLGVPHSPPPAAEGVWQRYGADHENEGPGFQPVCTGHPNIFLSPGLPHLWRAPASACPAAGRRECELTWARCGDCSLICSVLSFYTCRKIIRASVEGRLEKDEHEAELMDLTAKPLAGEAVGKLMQQVDAQNGEPD